MPPGPYLLTCVPSYALGFPMAFLHLLTGCCENFRIMWLVALLKPSLGVV
nr:hypothetical protein [uncultured Methanobacterium sp.]